MVRAGWMGSGPGALAGWRVPDAEQGSRLVRTVPGEPGTALLSTRALGMQPGAPPHSGCLSPDKCQAPGAPRGGREGDGGRQ